MRRPLPRLCAFIGAGLVAAVPSIGSAQAHRELLVGCDGAGKLVVRFDASKPFPLAASRFLGIEGYADGFPGFSTMIEGKTSEKFNLVDPQSSFVFVLVSAADGVAVWNDRGTALMRAGETFRLGNPPFDSHPVWNIVKGTAGKVYALRMQIRDTTGRYKDSDVFAPEFTPDDSTERYVCPMGCKGGAYFAASGLCPECGMWLKLLSGRRYQVTVTPAAAIRAGAATTLRFNITSPEGRPVTDFEIVHEKLLHLLMVSNDLSWFAHEHPLIQPDGSFTLTFTFPHAGAFTLYNDFTPKRVGMQVVPAEINVLGDAPPPVALTPTADRTQTVEGYKVDLIAAASIKSVQLQSLTFRVSRGGSPVTDLEPFLGATGHLIIVSQDRKNFVHSHPLEPANAAGGASTPRRGPEVIFNAQFPVPGLYKAWGQFQHQGRVITAPFVFEVVSPIGTSSR